jgi:NADPH oxidase 1
MTTKIPSWLTSQLTWRKLTFYIIFHGSHIALFALGWYLQATDERVAGLNRLKVSLWASRGAGLALSVDVTLLPLPMCRRLLRCVRPKFLPLHLDESRWFHYQVAYSLLFWTCMRKVPTSIYCANAD